MNSWIPSVSLRKWDIILIFQIEKTETLQKISKFWAFTCSGCELDPVLSPAAQSQSWHITFLSPLLAPAARHFLYLDSSPVYLREIPATSSVINNSMTCVMQNPSKTCSQNADSKYIPYSPFIFDLAKVLCGTVAFTNFHLHHQMFQQTKFQMYLTVKLKQTLIPP